MCFFNSCSEKPCELECLNGGKCIDGTCFCPNGFTGENCSTPVDSLIVTNTDTIYIVTDPCEDVICENGGICLNGTCDCPTGYMGDLCEMTYAEGLEGTYDVSVADCQPTSYTSALTAINSEMLSLSNFRDFNDSILLELVLIPENDSLLVNTQQINAGGLEYLVNGAGNIDIDDQSFTLELIYELFGNIEQCVETYTLQ